MQWLSLERICLEVLAWSPEPYWQLQKRRMQLLPEHVANALLQLLLAFGRLRTPSQLEVFRDSLSVVHITAASCLPLNQEWIAHISSLRHLHTLVLQDMPRLKDKALTPLAALAGTLQFVDVSGCGVTNKSLPVIAQLTHLHGLVLTGTSVQSPLLGHLVPLRHLTLLHLGGCDVSDADITAHITAFSSLQHLDLWGCAAGDVSARFMSTTLLDLRTLNFAWSKVSSALPLIPGLTSLDLSHCKLLGPCEDADLSLAYSLQQLQHLALAHVDADAAGCELLAAMLSASAARLRVLDLSNAVLANQLALLLTLEAASQLTALSLSNMHLTDDILPVLAACTSLQLLNLSLNPEVTEAGLGLALPGFAQQLQQLSLSGTGVSSMVLPLLRHLPRLKELLLTDTDVSWEAQELQQVEGRAAAAAETTGTTVLGGHIARGFLPDEGVTIQERGVPGPAEGHQSLQQRVDGRAPSWASLELLDLVDTQLTGNSCLQLVADMAAAAVDYKAGGSSSAAAAARASSSSTGLTERGGQCGLRVLLIGSQGSKLGRKALAGVGQLTTLEQLTLVGWQLTDTDLRHLQSLQHLQQLHIKGSDPWLLSDDGILQLCSQLPQMTGVYRDGQQLALPANHIGFSSTACRPTWQPPAAALAGNAIGSSCRSHTLWPAMSALGQHGGQAELPAVTVPWLLPYARQTGVVGHAVKQSKSPSSSKASPAIHGGQSRQGMSGRASSGAAGALHTLPQSSSGSTASSSATGTRQHNSATLFQRLSAFDERFKYTTGQLLAIREQLSEVCLPASDADTAPQRCGVADCFARVLPPEIQAVQKH